MATTAIAPLEVETRGVMINDEMGLGKSPQGIAIHNYLSKIHNANPENKRSFRTLVICPAQLRANWSRQIIKFVPNVNVKFINNTEPSEIELLSILVENHPFHIINYDLLARSGVEKEIKHSEYYTEKKEEFLWSRFISLANFDLIIVDESHYAKNPDAARTKALLQIQAKRWVFLSGTPVLNRPGEFWPSLNLINKRQFPSYPLFLSQYTFDKKIAKNVKELRELLKPIMIRRLKKDVIKDLPAINRIYEYSTMSPRYRKVYNKVLSGIWEDLQGNSKKITAIIAQITRLKQICSMDKYNRIAEMAVERYENAVEAEESHKKILIFTQWINGAYSIKKKLGDSCLVITGEISMDMRTEIVNEFQTNDKFNYLVCSTKAASEGLDITAAGTVIFADLMWTPAAHEQAEGRAYGRQNDSHGIDSIYLLLEDTIEEWIMDLLKAKMQIINQVVDGIEMNRDVDITGELIDKLRRLTKPQLTLVK